MAEPVSKSGKESIMWDYFSLEICRSRWENRPWWQCHSTKLLEMSASEAQEHFKPIGTLRTNYPALHSHAKAAMHEKGKQPAWKATPAPTQWAAKQLFNSRWHWPKRTSRQVKWKELTDEHVVKYFIAKDFLPIHMVEKSGFKRLLRIFGAWYQLPSCSYFSRTCYSDDSASQPFE